jgi:hypothetical protein
MNTWDTTFPPLLAKLHQLGFDYDDGEGMDFEPYEAFLPAEENASWLGAWTGNSAADGAQFRVFGQDGTGGYAAFWIVLPGEVLEKQPIVFLGSEGERGVVAANLDEYFWLLAAGVGPCEAVASPDMERKPNDRFMKFAPENSTVATLSATDVMARAAAAFPGFPEHIDNLSQ